MSDKNVFAKNLIEALPSTWKVFGGYVRDKIANEPWKDIDILLPPNFGNIGIILRDVVNALSGRCIGIGAILYHPEIHGTKYQITTPGGDEFTIDLITHKNPDSVKPEDWIDADVNSLYYNCGGVTQLYSSFLNTYSVVNDPLLIRSIHAKKFRQIQFPGVCSSWRDIQRIAGRMVKMAQKGYTKENGPNQTVGELIRDKMSNEAGSCAPKNFMQEEKKMDKSMKARAIRVGEKVLYKQVSEKSVILTKYVVMFVVSRLFKPENAATIIRILEEDKELCEGLFSLGIGELIARFSDNEMLLELGDNFQVNGASTLLDKGLDELWNLLKDELVPISKNVLEAIMQAKSGNMIEAMKAVADMQVPDKFRVELARIAAEQVIAEPKVYEDTWVSISQGESDKKYLSITKCA
jgi:hypothetical protein